VRVARFFVTIDLHSIAAKAGYSVEAFIFVQRGLDFTVRREHGDPPDELDAQPQQADDISDEVEMLGLDSDDLEELQELEADQPSRHVSGRQLCEGLRDFAIQEYGLLARTVLRRWRVYRTADFGCIVFAMVDAGMMQKTDEDTADDFADVYLFSDAFAPAASLIDHGN